MNYKIALIGMMGSGKTSTSKELSKSIDIGYPM